MIATAIRICQRLGKHVEEKQKHTHRDDPSKQQPGLPVNMLATLSQEMLQGAVSAAAIAF
jgi:hypothetical protein